MNDKRADFPMPTIIPWHALRMTLKYERYDFRPCCMPEPELPRADRFWRAWQKRKDAKEPCGECHLQEGETCDICGAQ